ncbi:MAG: hypothetical protein LH629_06735, partial [Ignavibacteria bacterium]|nr:hypothetical protein [Ignavibacteria bacterium]
MKRVNLLTKYSVLFFALFLLIIIFLSKVIDVSNEALISSSLVLLIVFIITVFFIYKEINLPLKKIFNLSGKLKLTDDDIQDFEYYDVKISELNNLLEDLQEMKNGKVLNEEIFEIITEVNSVAART